MKRYRIEYDGFGGNNEIEDPNGEYAIYSEIQAEIDRLKGQNGRLNETLKLECNNVTKLKAENQRYREALEKIEDRAYPGEKVCDWAHEALTEPDPLPLSDPPPPLP
jgi:predicted nuclease with TOPRIM domain